MGDDNKFIVPIEGDTAPLLKTLAGLGSLVAGAFTFKKMIDNAMEADRAVNSLNNAMKVAGNFTEEASKGFQDYAETLQKTTGISDDLITQNAALLVSIGQLSGQGLKDATKAALDLAAGTGKDVSTAFEIMSKAAQGNTAALGKMGIKISESIPESERFAAALDLINKRFGGLAEGKMNTFEGALTGLSNGFNDLLENFGKMFTGSPVLVGFIREIAGWFNNLAGSVGKFGASGDVIGDIIKQLIGVGLAITNYVMPPFELLYNLGEFVFNGIVSYINILVRQFAALANGIGTVGNAIGLVSDETKAGLDAFSESAQLTLDQSLDKTKASFQDMFNFDATAASANFLTQMETMAESFNQPLDKMKNKINDTLGAGFVGVSEGFSLTLDGLKGAMSDFAKKGDENFKNIGKSMFNSLGNAAGQAFAAFGSAIAKGENALQAFLNSLLASMGQMAIQLGVQFMLQGAAYMWAGMPNGPSLIAAGAALAAFGGVLSAVGGGGASASGGGAGGGGGAAASTDMASTEEDITELERNKPSTNITVQVQGNILDRRQTGLELAEVIQETFGTNGVNYNT